MPIRLDPIRLDNDARDLYGFGLLALLALLALSTEARADERYQDPATRPTLNLYGVTGLIDMPSAESQPSGQLSTTVSHFGGITRTSLTFQLTNRIEATFRYVGLADLNFSSFETYYDRSFDVSFRLMNETRYLPAVKIGLQDFAGTGLYSGEYLVATKNLSPRFKVTAGLGWGRLGTYGSFGAPFGSRPSLDFGLGGEPSPDQWFRGDAAVFGGLEYRWSDRISVMAEYSSDAYLFETGRGSQSSNAIIERKSPINLGAVYRYSDRLHFGGYLMHGSELGINVNVALNPYNPVNKGSRDIAPLPVIPRLSPEKSPETWSEEWALTPNSNEILLAAVAPVLAEDKIIVESLNSDGRSIDIRVRNGKFGASAQAIGRVARALTRTMPGSIETFRVVSVVQGLPTSVVTLRRSDIEALENAPNGDQQILAVAGVGEAGPRPPGSTLNKEFFPQFSWSIGPYVRNSYFDPSEPFRYQVGIEGRVRFEPRPGLVFSSRIQKRVAGNITASDRQSNSVLPRVRTDGLLYDKNGDPALVQLQGAYYFRPMKNVYGRVSVGYLERMFGGVSSEVLWKPVDRRLALGAELNWVKQRDYDVAFGFRDYDVATGHVSAYYDFGNGFNGQLDVGRYLAGDIGATFTLSREFRNGVKVGAFATLTDVSAEEFGEGSFDKGIQVEVPVSWFIGSSSKRSLSRTIRPIQRDGGARLSVDGRLYETVRDTHRQGLENQWARFWR